MVKLRAGIVIALYLLIVVGYLIFSQINAADINEWINNMAFSLYPLAGWVLLARHPRNPIGYLVTFLGLTVLGAGTLFEYASLALNAKTAGAPFTGEAAWGSLILWILVLPCLVLILLFFPNGRLLGRRWKLLVIFNILITLPVLIGTVVIAWPNRARIIFMDTGRIPQTTEMANLYRVYDMWNLAIILAIILALVSFFIRFSRSQGIERQQLKWFVYGLSAIPVSMVLDELVRLVDLPFIEAINYALNIISIAAFPVVMLIAITRYRLYDIDFIIRRTLLYSALTLTLALTYFGMVLVMQGLLTRNFGEQSELVIVLSTLLIAALFQPLRRRFQSMIDRRFYRSKYNAEHTLERFAARLQSEVDLDEMRGHIIAIVEENLQPERAQLWLIKK